VNTGYPAYSSYPASSSYDSHGHLYQPEYGMSLPSQYQTPHQVSTEQFATMGRPEGQGSVNAPVALYGAPIRSNSFDRGSYHSAYPTPTSNGHHGVSQSLPNSAPHQQLSQQQMSQSQMYLPSGKLDIGQTHHEAQYEDLFAAPPMLESTGVRPPSAMPSGDAKIATPTPHGLTSQYPTAHDPYASLQYTGASSIPPTCNISPDPLTTSTLNSAYSANFDPTYDGTDVKQAPMLHTPVQAPQHSVPGYYPPSGSS
jgi:hypothetical protein